MVGTPSPNDFKNMVRGNEIKNCPATHEDIFVANEIWGKDVHSLVRKTAHSQPDAVVTDIVSIPREILTLYNDLVILQEILTLHNDLVLMGDIMFINTLSRKLYFGTIRYVRSRKAKSIAKILKRVTSMYCAHDFCINHMLMDREFECLKN